MKLKKIISILIPLLIFSQFAYADIDSHPDYIIVALLLYTFVLGMLLLFVIAFIKRYAGNDHRANKWIYISSFVASCFVIYLMYLEVDDNGITKPFFILILILVIFILVSIITYKKRTL